MIALRPSVHHVAGPQLPADAMEKIERWVKLNLAAIVAYWDGAIDTVELAAKLKKI